MKKGGKKLIIALGVIVAAIVGAVLLYFFVFKNMLAFDKLEKAFDDNDYAKVREFSKEIRDTKYEDDALKLVEDEIDEIKKLYKKGDIELYEFEKQIKLLGKLRIEDVDDITEEAYSLICDIRISCESYDMAEEIYNSIDGSSDDNYEAYSEAYSYYSKVIEEDKNYKDARAKMKKCEKKMKHRVVVFDDDSLAGNNDPEENTNGADNGEENNDNEDENNKVVEKDVIVAPKQVSDYSDAKQLSLKVWCPSEEQEITKTLCELFDASHPEYTITFDYGVVSESDCKTQIELDPQNAADIFMFCGDHLKAFADGGYLAKLKDTTQAEVRDTHIAQAVDAASIEEEVYAVPFVANLWYMFYNKSMYTEDEVQSLDTMMAKNFPDVNGQHVYNCSIHLENGWYLASFFYAGGCTLFGPDGTDAAKCDWAEEKGIAVVNYISSLVQTNKLYNDAWYESITKLQDGTVAAYFTGSWNANAIKEALGDNYAATCAPRINIGGNEEWLKPFADFRMIGVNAQSDNKDAAQELAVFLGGEYSQLCRMQFREIQPTVKKLVENEAVISKLDYETNYPAVAASTAQLAHTVKRPSTPQMSNYWTIGEAIGKYIYEQDEAIINKDKQKATMEMLVGKITAAN